MTWVKEKKSRKAIVMAGGAVVLVVIGAVVAGLLLTRPVNAVTVLEVQGTVEVERPPDTLTARKGMRNQISDINPLVGLTNLTELSLNGNQISEAQIEELRAALPNCEIPYR
jgi:hypothetical protein